MQSSRGWKTLIYGGSVKASEALKKKVYWSYNIDWFWLGVSLELICDSNDVVVGVVLG